MALKGNPMALKAKAVAYIRTSSAANVGADKDSDSASDTPSQPSPSAPGLSLWASSTTQP
jgi:hypothetical protein